ncbi:MAG: flagellin [Methanoregula sp.]|jgi:flagellin FlaB|nr:flagellin [Methanoregula sp.]
MGKRYARPLCEDGFTGLEAAIVFVAFVVIAAVFSYTVLGAGFYTTETAQATVKGGVDQASSGLIVVGDIYGIKDTTNNYLDYVNITVTTTAGGTRPDLSMMVISYHDNNGSLNASLDYGGENTGCPTNMASSPNWCTTDDSRNTVVIMVGLPETATPNTKFTLYFQPATGSVTPVTKTVPGCLYPVQVLS